MTSTLHTPALIQAKVLEGIIRAAGVTRLEASRLLAGEGLRHDSLSGHSGADGMPPAIPLATYMRLFEKLAQNMGRPTLGLDLADRMGPGLVGPIGYVLLCSPTLSAGLEAFSHNVFSIQGVTSFAFSRQPAPMLTYTISDEAMRPRRHDVEFSLAYVHYLVRQGLDGAFAPREVYFEHARIGDLSHYERFFGCSVHFEQRVNALVLDEGDLVRPMARADPTLATMLRHYIALMDRRDAAPSSLSETVEQILSGIIGARAVTISDVAARLDTSVDTLRRQLRGEGMAFRTILRKKRAAMACRLLQDSDLSVLEIASRLGYGETASFTRAFMAETGEPPLAWRRRNRWQG